jgi:hypothetical protein
MIDSSTLLYSPLEPWVPCTHSRGTPISGTPFNHSKFKTYHKTPLTDAWVRAQTSLMMAPPAARQPCMHPGNKWLKGRSWGLRLTPSKTSRCAPKPRFTPTAPPRSAPSNYFSSLLSLALSLISLLSTATSRRIQTVQEREREREREQRRAPPEEANGPSPSSRRKRTRTGGAACGSRPPRRPSRSPGRLLGRIALPFPTALVSGFSASSSLSPLLEIESPVSSRGG